MSFLQNKVVPSLLILAMVFTPWCTGITVGVVVLTPTTVLLALAALLTFVSRLIATLPLLPLQVFKEPAFLSALLYFAVGVSSGFVADDKNSYVREIVQRTTIIWLPFYATSMGFRKLDDAKNLFLWYVPACGILALISTGFAVSTKFETPVYVLGLHKNMTASLCATMGIICVAHLLTSKRPKLRLPIIKLQLPNRLVYLGFLGFAILGIVGAQGRAGLLEVVAATFIMLIAMRAKPSTLVKVALICIVCTFLIYKMLPEKAIEHVITTERHSANAVRIEIWSEMGRNFMKNPMLACGWGNAYIDETGYVYYDLACVLLFDWMQMGITGVFALLTMITCSIGLGIANARKIPPHSAVGFINLAATGIVAGKFLHGMLDTFWIARGANLHTWFGVGVCLFVRLWLVQNEQNAPLRRSSTAPAPALATAQKK